MRIAQIHYQFPAEGGQERHVLNISRELVKRGHHVTVCTSNYFNSDEASKRDNEVVFGIKVHRLKGIFVDVPPRRIIIPKMLEYLTSTEYDVIHAHSMMSQPTEMALWAAKNNKIPFIYTPHFHPWQSYKENPHERRLRRSYEETYFKTLLEKSDQIIAVSDFEKQYFIDNFKIDKNKICVIPNGISIKDMNIKSGYRKKIVKRYNLKKNKKYILFTGLLTQRKCPLQTLKVFNIVSKYVPDVDLIMAGRKRDQYQKIIKYIAKNKLENRVKLIGYVSDNVKNALLERADILLMPSNYEAFGMIYIEALYFKTPVVSTNVGGISYAVMNRSNGYLVKDSKQIQTMAKYTIRLLHNSKLRKTMGEAGKARVERKFLWEKSELKIEKIYKELLRKKNNGCKK